MSTADIELIRVIFQRLADEGIEAVLENFHPDFEFTTPPDLASEPDTYRGHEGVRRWFDTFYEAMDRVVIEPTEIVDVGEGRVALSFRLVARGRSTGIELAQEAGGLVVLEDGLVVSMELAADLERILAKVDR